MVDDFLGQSVGPSRISGKAGFHCSFHLFRQGCTRTVSNCAYSSGCRYSRLVNVFAGGGAFNSSFGLD